MICLAFRVVYQHTQRWVAAGCFTALVDDLRLLLREAKGRNRQPSAAIFDSRTLQSTPRSVATMRVMMEPRDARAVKCMQPSIRLPNLLTFLKILFVFLSDNFSR